MPVISKRKRKYGIIWYTRSGPVKEASATTMENACKKALTVVQDFEIEGINVIAVAIRAPAAEDLVI